MSTLMAPRPPAVRVPHATVGVLLPLRLFLAAGWLRAAVEKLIDPSWWTGDVLDAFLADQAGAMLPFFGWFADALVAPLAIPVAWLVVEVQLVVGLCLLAGRNVRPALWAGVGLNVVFTMAGAVNPSAFYLVMELVLLAALSRPVAPTIALRRAVAWCVPAALVLPFASTLDPAHVIDDPALMLAFVAGLAALASLTVAGVTRPDVVRALVPSRGGDRGDRTAS